MEPSSSAMVCFGETFSPSLLSSIFFSSIFFSSLGECNVRGEKAMVRFFHRSLSKIDCGLFKLPELGALDKRLAMLPVAEPTTAATEEEDDLEEGGVENGGRDGVFEAVVLASGFSTGEVVLTFAESSLSLGL